MWRDSRMTHWGYLALLKTQSSAMHKNILNPAFLCGFNYPENSGPW